MRKIIVLMGVVFALVALSACTQEDPIERVIVNAPTQMVYTEVEYTTNGYNFKGDNGLGYLTISQAGIVTKEVFDGSLSDEPTGTSGVLEGEFIVNNVKQTFEFYVRPTNFDPNDDSIVLVNFRFEANNVKTNIGSEEDLTGLMVYIVRANDGSLDDVDVLTGEEAVALGLFDNNGYNPLQEDGFVNNEAFQVTFSLEGYTTSFEVYTAGGEKPIHTQDATFFDWILVIPVAFLTQFFASIFNNSFAIGILITTIIVRTLAWPIYAKSNDMSLKMNLAQPEMQRIQAKYVTRKDPQSQQQMQSEMMGVYKKYGISTLGCLMPFLQMPIFIAMYGVVRRITLPGGMYTEQVSNTNFLGIDLAETNTWLIAGLLAAIVGATMFALQILAQKKPAYAKNTGTQNLTPQAAQTQKTMKYVTYFMVFMMMSISYQSQALAVYWIFGNIYSLVQTLVNRKISEKKHEQLKQKELFGGLIDAKKN